MSNPESKSHESGRANREPIKIVQQNAVGLVWFGGWLFTIGYLHLPFWKALVALVAWTYYLGTALALPSH
jgi:hypothetical protein